MEQEEWVSKLLELNKKEEPKEALPSDKTNAETNSS